MPGYDFNGDGRDDVLWRNISTGYTSNWLGTPSGGFYVNDEVALDRWGHEYIVAVGDFNGDGRDDTLWRSDGTELFMGFTEPDGAFYFYWNLGFVPPEVPISWHVLGAGDFNGDGLDDILWRHDDGRISNWLSNGDYEFTINDANAMTSALADWPVQAIGDFDGNGRDDILVRHANGALDVLNGSENGSFAADYSEPFTQAPLDWNVAGVGDFNGDGKDDIASFYSGNGYWYVSAATGSGFTCVPRPGCPRPGAGPGCPPRPRVRRCSG